MTNSFQRYFIRFAFDGSTFHGWQRQPNGISVQQTMETAMTLVLKVPVKLTGAGRTDTGVHASQFYAHFDIPVEKKIMQIEKLVFSLNSCLGRYISVDGIFMVGERDHARFSALTRTYRYHVLRKKDPFRVNYAHFVYGNIDLGLMNMGADYLIGIKDFTSFSKVDTDTKTNLCDIYSCIWTDQDNEMIFTIKANRFLRNMVRSIAGTLLDLGRGRITMDQLIRIVEGKDRQLAGESVPAKGLFLTEITYPENIILY